MIHVGLRTVTEFQMGPIGGKTRFLKGRVLKMLEL